MDNKDDQAIIREALQRFDVAQEAENENRRKAVDDIRFVYDEDGQWEESAKNARKNRPCMTFDQVSGHLDQIIGDQLQNRPGIKVRGTDDNADPDTAETFTGLIRNIESGSSAKRAYDHGFKMAAVGGYGVWRVVTDFNSDDSFDQDVFIKGVRNPFTALPDPSAQELDKSDGLFWFVHETLSREEFDKQYPKANSSQFDNASIGTQYEGWYSKEEVRIAEYWRKTPETKTILLLSTGEVVDKSEAEPILDELEESGISVVKEREVKGHVVEWFKITATEILERGEWAGKYIPIVPVYGKTANIEGEERYRGAVRKAKDAQRSYNYHRSQSIEAIALAPKAPLMATPKMVEGHESQYQTLNTENRPLLLYNFDPQAPGGRPTREPPPAIESALYAEAGSARDDIKAATGIFDASLGARSNETSGKAILARQREGDTANYEFTENLSAALELTGKILVDLIPRIYDTERQIRVLGEDGSEEFIAINQTVFDEESGQPVTINNLSQGKYDVTVTVGPSYSTRRIESADQLIQLGQSNPQIGAITADLLVKSLDMVGGDEVNERLRKLGIQQGYIEPSEEEIAEAQQNAPQGPSPAEVLAMEKEVSEVEKTKAETEKIKIEAALKLIEVYDAEGNLQAKQLAQSQLLNLLQQQPASAGFLLPEQTAVQ